jgi:hypothetical protein
MALNPSPSNLDQQLILQRVMDSANDRLRVDAAFSAAGTLTVKVTDGVDDLAVNPDGSINTNMTGTVAVNISHTDDSIRLGDGTILFTGSTVGSKNGLDINVINPLFGTEDGTVGGTQRVFVNNRKQQVLASHDRTQAVTWADFNTKNERITQVDYTSGTFPGITIRKLYSYTLTSGAYRLDNITWSIV